MTLSHPEDWQGGFLSCPHTKAGTHIEGLNYFSLFTVMHGSLLILIAPRIWGEGGALVGVFMFAEDLFCAEAVLLFWSEAVRH